MLKKVMNWINVIKEPFWPSPEQGFVGLWENEDHFVKGAKALSQAGFTRVEAITPFPVHGLDQALGLKRSWIPYVTFCAGLTGLGLGIWLTWWASAVSWPLMVGGKPMWSLAAFIPIISS